MKADKRKRNDDEALAELKAWCRPFGLEPRVFFDRICVTWLDPAKPDDKWGSIVAEMHRPMTGGRFSHYSFGSSANRVSTAATCRKLIKECFSGGHVLGWARETKIRKQAYNMTRIDNVQVSVPAAGSPAELEIKLAALGWTGNPFGPSRNVDQAVDEK